MNEAAALQARLVGALVVDRGLVTEEQLERALEIQAATEELLGEILVNEFGVSRVELASVLAEQWAELERETSNRSAEPVVEDGSDDDEEPQRRRIGEIFVERGFVTQAELEHALDVQRGSGRPLGEVLIELGSLSRMDLASALAEQWSGLEKLRKPAPRPVEGWQQVAPVEHAAAAAHGASRETTAGDGGRAVRETLDALTTRLDTIAGASGRETSELRASLESLRKQIGELEGRIDEPSPALLSRLDELEAATRAIAEAAASAPWADETRELGNALEQLRLAAEETPRTLDGIVSRIAAVESAVNDRTNLDELSARLAAIETDRSSADVQAEIAALRRTVDEVRAVSVDRGALDALSAALEEVRGSIPDPAERFGGLEERLAVVEQAAQRAGDAAPVLEELSARIEALRASVPEVTPQLTVIEERLSAIEAAAADPSWRQEAEALREELRQVRGSIPDPAERFGGLEERLAVVEQAAQRAGDAAPVLEELSARIEALRASVPEVTPQLTVIEERLSAIEAAAADPSWRHELGAVRAELHQLRSESAPFDGHEAVEELRSQLEALRAAIPDRDALQHDVQGMLDTVRAGLPDWGPRLDALANEVETLRSTPDAGGERMDAVERRIVSLEEARAAAPWRQEIAALSAELARVSQEADRAAHGHDAEAMRGVADDLRAALDTGHRRLDELAGLVQEISGRVATVEATGASAVDVHTLDQLRAEVAALVGSVDESRRAAGEAVRVAQEVAAAEQTARAAFEGQVRELVDGVAAGAARSDVVDGLATRLGGEIAELADRFARVEHSVHLAATAHANAVEAAVAGVRAELADERAAVEPRLAAVESLAVEVQELYARMHASEEQTAALWSARPPDHGETLHALEARLALTERALAAGPDTTLEARLVAIEERLAAEAAQADERTKATERALRKGLASVAAELSAREDAYTAAGNELRRSIERLGRAVVDADVRIAVRGDEETLASMHRAAGSHVAFVPTEDGYRLLPLDGPPPPLGTIVPMDGHELVVTRIGASPLPLDERPCVYLARA